MSLSVPSSPSLSLIHIWESTRYSSTLLEKTTYYAKRLSDGTVLRRCAPKTPAQVLRAGALELNPEEHTVTVDGARVALTLSLIHISTARR